MSWTWESLDGGGKKRTLVPGPISEMPAEASICSVVFSESSIPNVLDGARDIKIGQADSEAECRLELAICTMVAGEEALVDVGAGTVKVKLESFIRGKEIYEMDNEEKLRLAAEHKERGVCLIVENRFKDSYKRFQKAVKLLIFADRGEEPAASLFLAVCANIALCHLKLGRFEDAVLVANKVLDKKPDHVKVLFRRALARQELRDFEKAHDDFAEVLRLEPNNALAASHLQEVKREIADSNARYESMVKKMFPFASPTST